MKFSYDRARQQSLSVVFNRILTESYLGAEFMKAYLGDKSSTQISFEGKTISVEEGSELEIDLSGIEIAPDDEAFLEFAKRVKKDFPLVEAVEPCNGNAIEFTFKTPKL